MVNFSLLILDSEITGPGGLFDIDATSPLVAIQFILLTVILNIILYSPLLAVITERNEYILKNLSTASDILSQANNLTTEYEEGLANIRKEAQLEITNSQETYKEILETEVNISRLYISLLLDNATIDLMAKRKVVYQSLNSIVKSLCTEVETKLLI
jgi:F-type H+-transporting ATPase subunit b